MVRLFAKVGPLDIGVANDLLRHAVGDLVPATSTTSRVEKAITARMMCSIKMIVMPWSLSRNSSVENVLDLRVRQPGHRLVGEEQRGLGRDRARQFELAHLDLRQVTRQPARLAGEPDLREQFLAARPRRVAGDARDRCGAWTV